MGVLASQIPPTLFLKMISTPSRAGSWGWKERKNGVGEGMGLLSQSTHRYLTLSLHFQVLRNSKENKI